MSAEEPREARERLRRVEALYHEMLARPAQERAAALAAACPGDPALAAEVQALLDQPQSAEGPLGTPALEVAARLTSTSSSSLCGRRVGVFEVQSLLGAGGMGEVYRAHDTRLGRSVAIKILPRAFKADADRLARFEREARTLASLNHPHVCTLYDVGHHEGIDYLVMELVEGETLAERLRRGALPLDQTLRIAIEIADALDKAHRQGIIHRDLKPGNVMLTKSGSKLMDFGLAKLKPLGRDLEAVSALPTASEPFTGEGTLMGTVPYMAPEQLEGKGPDARSDLWAFGCLMYEMATGSAAFEGRSQASLISAIMAASPLPISQVQPLTPPALARLVKVCLAKDPEDRFQVAHDVMQELKWIAETPGTTPPVTGSGRRPVATSNRRWALGVGGSVLLASLVINALLSRRLLAPAGTSPPVAHVVLSIAPADELNSGAFYPNFSRTAGGSSTALTWTPDGRSLVFVGRQGGVQRLYVRALDSERARPLEGTEGAQLPTVSADGKWVAFWVKGPASTQHGSIRKVPLAGGTPTTVIDDVSGPTGMAWAGDRVFYGPADCGSAQYVICSAAPEHGSTPVTKREIPKAQLPRHTLPHLLPDGRALLYTVRNTEAIWGDDQVVAHVFATGEDKVLLEDAVGAHYLESGHLIFLRRGTLFGVEFDLSRMEITGTPIPVLDKVSQALRGSSENATGAGQFSVASTGTLAWVRGEAVIGSNGEIVGVDRRGGILPLNVTKESHGGLLGLSPDGRLLAGPRMGLKSIGMWIYDLDRGTSTKLEEEGKNNWPRWTPDGERVAFSNVSKGVLRIAWRKADGTGPLETLVNGYGAPSSWSPDGRELAFLSKADIYENSDIWIATLRSGAVTIRPFFESPDQEWCPEFSPDGRWLAYTSNTTGQHEVYVQPYPGPGPRQQVSVGGGINPAWNPAGREIFFLSPLRDGTRAMMSVEVGLGHDLSIGSQRQLFKYTALELSFGSFPNRPYAVAPDGRLFYVVKSAPSVPAAPVTQIGLITNWVEELKAKVAAGQAK